MGTGFSPQYQQYPQQVQYPQYSPYTQYPAQIMPYQMQPYNTAAQTPAPSSSVGAVNIQIFNPTANGGVQHPQYQAQQPVMPLYQNASLYGAQGETQAPAYPMNYNAQINQTQPQKHDKMTQNAVTPQNTPETAPKEEKEEVQKEAGNKVPEQQNNTKEKVILTDDYIRSLENYLNNQDPKIRLTAAKELLERFKEDDTRKSDPALSALLNKVIQDPKATIRYIGLTILDVGYAQGNGETIEILKQLQNRTDLEYGEDAALAAQILLKMSAQTTTVPDLSQNINNEPQTQEAA